MDYSGPFMIEARKPPPDPVTLQLEVSAEDTVAALKGRLASQREDWSSEQMNVILQGKFLQDPQTMAECELKNGDFVVITGMVARDFRRPAQEEAELRREGEGEEGTPFFAPPAVVNLPTDNQSIERT
jgi:molybdopterin converting factor small subunit